MLFLTDVGVDEGHLLPGLGELANEEAGVGALAGIRTAQQQDHPQPLLQNRRRGLSPLFGNIEACHRGANGLSAH